MEMVISHKFKQNQMQNVDSIRFSQIVIISAMTEIFYAMYKNVLQEWHAYIRTMVQFHVLGEIAWGPAMGRYQ